ncbi:MULTISPECIES: hypothetical protein [Methylobacterium]|uniref:Uncharacterized protein n=1 Tax=Methylobacterium bullatum TaxID=570505 RepID=A0AAV4Z5H0_9HYPH|nr:MULTISPECIES: hypothetical protein [Methylobacterium]KQO45937.1 hypothetical protein ASF08_05650 [Methylobacterium sp. Leaf85]TXN26535.1 hypothetical protein FV220_14835 [Methylobacterium sp. WL19]GJD38754.1 hypothetical protein OICFNHDK_1205 [Methylobacterium bullatum]
MLRSGFILSVGGPAALLTMLVHPILQREADLRSPPGATVTQHAPATVAPAIFLAPMGATKAGGTTLRVSTALSVQRRAPGTASDQNSALTDKPVMKPRRTMRDGCEGAISSLAGPEARRMIPGRCIA